MRVKTLDISDMMADAQKRFGLPEHYQIDWYAFPQMWGGTQLGFGGIGGCAMTTAQTVIIGYGNKYMIYFGGRFAYEVCHPNEKFYEDMRNWHMASVKDSKKYRRVCEHD